MILGSWPYRCPGRVAVLVMLGGLVLVAPASRSEAANAPKWLSEVSITPAFFNPSIGQRAQVAFTVSREGAVELEIVDRDHFPVRRLPSQPVQPGPVALWWDGRDDGGEIVPDEAYSLRVTFRGSEGSEVLDVPRNFVPAVQSITGCSYSKSDGVLSYTLPWPARVRLQAGQLAPGTPPGSAGGPVLKTIVDRSPRVAGAVVEHWNGLDESGLVFVPDLPHFVVAIAAEQLPELVVIAVGNRAGSFFDYAQRHRPRSALAPRKLGRGRPGRPTALEDRTPRLDVGASSPMDPVERCYLPGSEPLEVALTLDPQAAQYFLNPMAELSVFVDETLVVTRKAGESPTRIVLAAGQIPPGTHRVAFDWASGHGPVAVATIQVRVDKGVLPGNPSE